MSETNRGSKIVTGVLWRFGEKVTAQMVSFMVSIVLARLLLPNDYGIVAIVNIFISIAEVFVTSGLGTALIQKRMQMKLTSQPCLVQYSVVNMSLRYCLCTITTNCIIL